MKFANSLKLRLAIRIVYADEDLAQQKAEEAIRDGVFADNEDNAMLKVDGSATVNPLYMICYTYNDSRLGATMESYLKGYDDLVLIFGSPNRKSRNLKNITELDVEVFSTETITKSFLI